MSKWTVTVQVGRHSLDPTIEHEFGQQLLRQGGMPFFAGFLPNTRLLTVLVFIDANTEADALAQGVAVVNKAAAAAGIDQTWEPTEASATRGERD